MRTAKVAVSAVPYFIDQPYDYLIPEELAARAVPGVRTVVPFGRGNRPAEGFILEVGLREKGRKCKALLEVLDDAPVLDAAGIRLAFWLQERYFCTFYDALKTVLPAGLWYRFRELYRLSDGVTAEAALAAAKSAGERAVLEALLDRGGEGETEELKALCGEKAPAALRALAERGVLVSETVALRKVGDKAAKVATLVMDAEEAMALVEPKKRSAPVRYEAVKLLCTLGSAAVSELCYFTGASMQTLRSLEKAGVLAFSEAERLRVPAVERDESAPDIVLNEEQQAAYEGIVRLMEGKEGSVSLLQGVTGSGKTQVYLRLAQHAVDSGRTAMVLVPEIALTPQLMAKFSAYFGEKAAMLHSSLGIPERYDQWKRIRRGEVKVVLGTRSAVFAPLQDLGLIVMDEEQEGSYQSENPPRYHTRDVAKYRAAKDGAALVLGSATPSVESAYQAKQGVYHHFLLRRRFNERALPQVVTADMRRELRNGNGGTISALLEEELRRNLYHGEQSILLLNRRGSSRMLVCGECGAVPYCPRCSVPLTYHSANGRLMCHYCGHSEPAEERCGVCGGQRKPIGFGTQKVEEELREKFPKAEILRMDADTVNAKNTHEKLLARFQEEKIPILLGTQMVAKGLDFENVTLVGVLSADLSLYVDSFRAAERTFHLLTQAVGRSGRGEKPGRAVIQTFTPENDVIESACRQDYERFYEGEIRLRKLRGDPPFADLFTLTVSGPEEEQVRRAVYQLRGALEETFSAAPFAPGYEVVGPAPAPVVKVNNRFRYRILLAGRNHKAVRDAIRYYLVTFHRQKENRGMSLTVDCNAPD
ncbi:MAG: primosomal protein N' [Oscillospiraceae bacterium]